MNHSVLACQRLPFSITSNFIYHYRRGLQGCHLAMFWDCRYRIFTSQPWRSSRMPTEYTPGSSSRTLTLLRDILAIRKTAGTRFIGYHAVTHSHVNCYRQAWLEVPAFCQLQPWCIMTSLQPHYNPPNTSFQSIASSTLNRSTNTLHI